MPQVLSYRVKGYRDVLGRFAKRSAVLEARRRDAMRRVGRMVVSRLAKNAPKKTGTFARGITFRTYDRGHATQMKAYATGEHGYLLKWIREGTKPHPIPRGGSAEMMAKGYPLRFYWEKGPAGPGIYRFWSVNHPGTKPNPFIEDTVAAVEQDVIAELRMVAASVARI